MHNNKEHDKVRGDAQGRDHFIRYFETLAMRLEQRGVLFV
jgi:hypothetical protein